MFMFAIFLLQYMVMILHISDLGGRMNGWEEALLSVVCPLFLRRVERRRFRLEHHVIIQSSN